MKEMSLEQRLCMPYDSPEFRSAVAEITTIGASLDAALNAIEMDDES